MEDLLSALPPAETSLSALIICLVALSWWTVVALRARRVNSLLRGLEKVPEPDREDVLARAMGAALPADRPVKEWLRGKRWTYATLACLAALAGFFVFGGLTLWSGSVAAVLGLVLYETFVAVTVIATSSRPLPDRVLQALEWAKQAVGERSAGRLELVDVAIDETDEYPVLGVRVKNVGGVPAVIRKYALDVSRVWTLEPDMLPTFLPAPWRYDVKLPSRDLPRRIEHGLSQPIYGHSARRFTLVLGNDHDSGYPTGFIYQISLALVYDDGAKTVSTGEILFYSRSASHVMSGFSLPGHEQRAREANGKVVEQVRSAPRVRSARLSDMIASYSTDRALDA